MLRLYITVLPANVQTMTQTVERVLYCRHKATATVSVSSRFADKQLRLRRNIPSTSAVSILYFRLPTAHAPLIIVAYKCTNDVFYNGLCYYVVCCAYTV